MSTLPSRRRPLGDLLRAWRRRRRMSQLDVALEAGVSQRHLSFVESGRAQPSRGVLVDLAEAMDVPLRERNGLLLAAGFAPSYPERRLDDPALAPARAAVELVLKAHEPLPALAVDRHWAMVAANAAVAPFLDGVEDQALLAPPVNVLRLSLHPEGLAPRIANLAEWRGHLLARLRREAAASADPTLAALLAELSAYPGGEDHPEPAEAAIAVPLRLTTPKGVLSFISTTTVFGTATDVTLAELAIEAFFPADEATRRALATPS